MKLYDSAVFAKEVGLALKVSARVGVAGGFVARLAVSEADIDLEIRAEGFNRLAKKFQIHPGSNEVVITLTPLLPR